jgi:hypothetical protein
MNFEQFLSWERDTQDCIDFKKSYVYMTGDLIAGLMLSSIIYWYLPTKNGEPNKLACNKYGHMWIVSARKDWWERCCITDQQAKRALNLLIKQGLIVKQIHRWAGIPTMHIRVVEDVFLKKMMDVIEGRTSTAPQKKRRKVVKPEQVAVNA